MSEKEERGGLEVVGKEERGHRSKIGEQRMGKLMKKEVMEGK